MSPLTSEGSSSVTVTSNLTQNNKVGVQWPKAARAIQVMSEALQLLSLDVIGMVFNWEYLKGFYSIIAHEASTHRLKL